MNYLLELKAFGNFIELHELSTGQIVLWYALMHINNKCAWIEWFTAPNIKLCLQTGLSRQSVVKCREVLKKLNVLDYKTNGMNATAYKLNSLQVHYPSGLQAGLPAGLQAGLPLTKQDKIKQYNTKQSPKNKKYSSSYDIDELDKFWDTVPTLD